MAIILTTNSYRLMIAAIVMEGLVATVRQQVSVIYLYESFRNMHYAKTFGIVNCCEGLFGICGALYFLFISKSWFYLVLAAFILQVIGTIGCMFYHESPKYLIASGQLDRAHQVFKSIAYMNKADQSLVSEQRIDDLFKEENLVREENDH